MALADLNRAGDTPIATLKLAEITPKDWPTLPAAVGDLTLANANASKPRYNSMADWAEGNVGDDVTFNTACVALANASGGAPAAQYVPRTQSEKSTMLGGQNPLAVDVSRARGAIAPQQPYPVAGDTPVAAPVITSLTPNTAVAGPGGLGLIVDIIGTGFTPWSTVTSGNYPIPIKYISPTQLRIAQFPQNSVPGVVAVQVWDHNVGSNVSDFTFT